MPIPPLHRPARTVSVIALLLLLSAAVARWRSDPSSSWDKAPFISEKSSSAKDDLSPKTFKPIPVYDSPEAFLKDYDHAMSFVSSTETVNRYLVEYSACMAFKEKSIERCNYVDPIINENMQLFNCKPMFAKGVMTKEMVEGKGGIEGCLLDVQVWKDVRTSNPDFRDDHIEPEGEAQHFCRSSIQYWHTGDLNGYCRFLKKEFPNEPEPRPCPINYAYIPGDPDKCPDFDGDQNWVDYCRMSATLIHALRYQKPEMIAHLQYAPLLNPKAGCKNLAVKFLAEYQARARLKRKIDLTAEETRLFEIRERIRGEREKAAEDRLVDSQQKNRF